MRRENNTGTIYKLSGARRNPYIARYPDGYDDGGNRKWITVGYFRTKAEAARGLSVHMVQPVSPKNRITLSELYAEWKTTAFNGLAKRSVEIYENSYKHLMPLHGQTFNNLRAANFQNIINNSGLGFSSCAKIRSLLNQLYKYAIINDISYKNYALGIKIPKKPEGTKEIFSEIERQKLFNNDSADHVDSVLVLIYTGLRIGELLNLTKFDVDFKGNAIRVTKSKTQAGTGRIVPISQKILKYIKARYDRCENYLFANDHGKKQNTKDYRNKKYKVALLSSGVDYKVPHVCRHTAGTIFKEAGMDDMAIKEILGHEDYAFTANRYTHPDVKYLNNQINKV